MAENVRVIVRCRPMNKMEIELKCKNIINISGCSLTVENPNDKNAPSKAFTFDNAYDGIASTENIYSDVCYSLVDNVLEGYNGTIFAYGQTGCGKTHTMQGPDVMDSANGRGVITRALDHVFEAISVASDVRYLALVSYLEIYNENLRDLLNTNESIITNHALKEIPGVGITVPTLSTHTVLNAKDCYELLRIGNQNRVVGATLMNANSSRSHSIFTISLEQIPNENDAENILAASLGIRRGKLNLVDLAGSERQNKTGAVGERLKEATKINLSLSALGNVISALVDGKTKHIPYRDSKLTRLLQDSLGGNTKTLMISCVSPAESNYDETLSTLRYASRAKNISNKPIINEDPKDAKLREFQEEIIKLKYLLDNSQNTKHIDISSTISEYDYENFQNEREKLLSIERLKLKEQMESEVEALKRKHEQHEKEKDEHFREIESLRMHYEEKFKSLSSEMKVKEYAGTLNVSDSLELQLDARKRIDAIKKALIGGERANDIQLKEFRQKKRIDAQRRLSALAHALSRVEQSEDRDLLQIHYSNIHQELQAKNDYIKRYRQKVKALEREVSDLQSEFQIDRADYLETIRRTERNLKFYQQLTYKALPILRKNGKYWDPDEIIQESVWNDDFKTWKFPETMNALRLPPANITKTPVDIYAHRLKTSVPIASQTQVREILNSKKNNKKVENLNSVELIQLFNGHNRTSDKEADILNNYFRPNRSKYLEQKHKLTDSARLIQQKEYPLNTISNNNSLNILPLPQSSKAGIPTKYLNNGVLTSNDVVKSGLIFNKSWAAVSKRILSETSVLQNLK